MMEDKAIEAARVDLNELSFDISEILKIFVNTGLDSAHARALVKDADNRISNLFLLVEAAKGDGWCYDMDMAPRDRMIHGAGIQRDSIFGGEDKVVIDKIWWAADDEDTEPAALTYPDDRWTTGQRHQYNSDAMYRGKLLIWPDYYFAWRELPPLPTPPKSEA